MGISKLFFRVILPNLLIMFGFKKNSWKFKKMSVFVHSLIMIPVKKFKGVRRTTTFVEKQYDQISGSYIQDNYYRGKKRFSVVNGKILKISSIKNMELIRNEIRTVLKNYNFKNILEVGVGELTTLEDIYKFKKGKVDCYGIDLSLNRLIHGLHEFKKRHPKIPRVSKSNATMLPFPDNSFDLVLTRHTLEQMPENYKQAIDEIIRVSKKYFVLFEPSFELGSLTQKLKILNSDYVRGIPNYLLSKKNLIVKKPYLMKNSANPLNHTACTVVEIKKSIKKTINKEVPFVCPVSKEKLKYFNDFLYSSKKQIAYPVINKIPILDPSNSFKMSKL
jgi:ubiquinone/menaquinone biosynthesis C-methylase UbiE